MNELVTQSSGLIPATTSASLEAIKSNFGIIQEAQRSVPTRISGLSPEQRESRPFLSLGLTFFAPFSIFRPHTRLKKKA